MYFHPLILTEAQKRRRSAAYRECARLWLEGIDPRHRRHADAMSEFSVRQQQSLRVLSESLDVTPFVVRWGACAASAPLELLHLSMQVGDIAADVQRQVVAILDRHTKELCRSVEQEQGRGSSPSPSVRECATGLRGKGRA